MQQKSFFKTEAVGNDYNLFTHLFIQQILYFLHISHFLGIKNAKGYKDPQGD